jgi:uncharacterized membrane protein YvbJ
MFYCQNCGAKIESAENFCSFCGYSFEKVSESDDKDARIKELEQKINRLEQSQVRKKSLNPFSPWIAIVPVAFVAAFFGFFILLIWIIRQ